MGNKVQIIGDYLDFVIVKYSELPAPYHAYHREDEIPNSAKGAVAGYDLRRGSVWPLVAMTHSQIFHAIHDWINEEADKIIGEEL